MSEVKFHCHRCGKYCGEMTEGRIRNGTLHTCKECAKPKPRPNAPDIPDFMSQLFGGKL